MADVSSGSPQIFVNPVGSSAAEGGDRVSNKFERAENWFGRSHTRLERERIERRMLMRPGEATQLLKKMREAEVVDHNNGLDAKEVDVSANEATPIINGVELYFGGEKRGPMIEDLADEELMMDRERFDQVAAELNAQTKKELRDRVKKDKNTPLICQRCHDLRQNDKSVAELPNMHSDRPDLQLNEQDRLLLKKEMNSESLIVLLADLTDLPGSLPLAALDLLTPYLPEQEADWPGLVLVGNKLDLMPLNMRHMEEYFETSVRRMIGDRWVKRILRPTHLISAKEGDRREGFVVDLLCKIKERRGSVLLVGKTNVGKSQLYNALLGRDYYDLRATVSDKAGTTIGIIKARLGQLQLPRGHSNMHLSADRYLMDLPGIVHTQQSLCSLLTMEEAKKAVLRHRQRYQRRVLCPGETGLIGGLIRIECEGPADWKNKLVIKAFMRRDWSYFRLPTAEVEAFVEANLGRMRTSPPHLTPPYLDEGVSDPRWSLFAHPRCALEIPRLSGSRPMEVSFSDGIGWLSLSLPPDAQETFAVRILTPNGIGVSMRDSLDRFVKDVKHHRS